MSTINSLLILITFLFTGILGLNPLKTLSPNFRSLSEITDLTFVKAQNLIFNSDLRWEFTIEYSTESSLNSEAIYYTSILYKESPTTASCEVTSSTILKCYLNEGGQTIFDLIKLNNQVTAGATIRWTNLDEVKDIAINTILIYEDSYSLTYYSSGQYWTFRVKLV